MDLNTINNIFNIFSCLNKEPATELKYSNEFTLVIAVVLSAKATDSSVNKVTSQLFLNYKTPENFLELGQSNLEKYIKSIGLYKSKAKSIIALSRILVDKHNSSIPNNFQDLIKLPGIGRKSANVILNSVFNVPTIAVDTHVTRVSNRIGLTVETIPKKIEEDLLKKIPDIWLGYAHNWLVMHGKYICKAKKAQCYRCPILNLCKYQSKNF